MQLVNSDDRILTTVSSEFDFHNPPFDPVEFANNLVKSMYDWNGLGLTAVQVGVPYAVFAMRGNPENFVCFNPKIIQPSEALITLEENCLTFPGLCVKIKRHQHLRVRFQTPMGETLTKQFTGMTARVFQHNLDYLKGELFFNNANKFHRDQALKRWKRQ